MSVSTLGHLSLNISFVIYLLVYLPQLIHNRHTAHLAHLSVGMHIFLYTAYCLDLLYGIASHFQWQYQVVSLVGVTLMLVQHAQLMHYFWRRDRLFVIGNGLFLAFSLVGLVLGCLMRHDLSPTLILLIGALSRFCFLSYTVPQVIKNYRQQSAQAVSLHFVYLSLVLSLLDMISAWCLNWGWPNKLGAPVSAGLMLLLLFQIRKYRIAISSRQFC